ncbi:hypothetical protein [Halalkalibacillus halophilus]|uniref:hypothetical protein n=1 Tax=Halalkalibacillus halophilus TaxID=392827 RepID=UPI000417275D|nr:hypothetical protein [Halalkalibacillus halophilus]
MLPTLLTIIGILFIFTLIATLVIGKKTDDQIKEYERRDASPQEELERSREYEQTSMKKNIPNLAGIYVVYFILVIIACIVLYFVLI